MFKFFVFLYNMDFLILDVDECSSDLVKCIDDEYCFNIVGLFYCGSK